MKKMIAILLGLVLGLVVGIFIGVYAIDKDNESAMPSVKTIEVMSEEDTESASVEGNTEATLPTEVENNSLFVCEYDTSTYYYDQLSEPEQEIYNLIGASTDRFINNEKVCVVNIMDNLEYGFESYELMVKRALMAYQHDNPISSIYLSDASILFDGAEVVTENDYPIEIGYFVVPQGYKSFSGAPNTPQEVYQMISEVEEVTKAFVQTLEGSEQEKLKMIHDWIVNGCEYSLDARYLRDIYGCIIEKTCCCAGYAYAMKYVADMADLDVIVVVGLGIDPGASESVEDVMRQLEDEGRNPNVNHAWNYVFTEEMGWTLVDATWDSTIYNVGTGNHEDVYLGDGEYLGYFEITEDIIIPNDEWLFVELESDSHHIVYDEIGFKYP